LDSQRVKKYNAKDPAALDFCRFACPRLPRSGGVRRAHLCVFFVRFAVFAFPERFTRCKPVRAIHFREPPPTSADAGDIFVAFPLDSGAVPL
jgi:hypothetical protein